MAIQSEARFCTYYTLELVCFHVLYLRVFSLVASVTGCFIDHETCISGFSQTIELKSALRKAFLLMIRHSSYILLIRIHVSKRLKICIKRLKTVPKASPR